MPELDLPLEELHHYRSPQPAPPDLDAFWERTLDEARALGADVSVAPVDTGFTTVSSYDVRFPGFGGESVCAWLHVPRGQREPLPAVVRYAGYGGGRGLPHEDVFWANAGYAQFVMDTRGQGAGWSRGDTDDPHGSGPAHPGFMTRGIDHPDTYYFRRVMTDAVRAIDAAAGLDAVDAGRIAVAGGSQGGGLALAAAALHPGARAALIDVPFLCHFPRALRVAQQGPYTELVGYLKVRRTTEARALSTLAYFDGAHLAPRAQAPALFSVALMDPVCPPSTVFAAYNAYGGAKSIEVYPYNEHEGGGAQHQAVQLRWLADLW